MTVSKIPCPTVIRLLINYDEVTGLMTWKNRPAFFSNTDSGKPMPNWAVRFNSRYAGKPALRAEKGNGYLYGNIFNKNALAHRVAWCISKGYWPKGFVDHINGVRSDNRIENLRDVSCSENNRNRIHPARHKHYGISKVRGKWAARISIGGKNICLGTFPTESEAAIARVRAEIYFWGENPSTRRSASYVDARE